MIHAWFVRIIIYSLKQRIGYVTLYDVESFINQWLILRFLTFKINSITHSMMNIQSYWQTRFKTTQVYCLHRVLYVFIAPSELLYLLISLYFKTYILVIISSIASPFKIDCKVTDGKDIKKSNEWEWRKALRSTTKG